MTVDQLFKEFVPNPDEVILIKSLFSHPGWIKYEECLKRDIIFLESEIQKLTNGVTLLDSQNIESLKHLTIFKRALVLMSEIYKDELLNEIKNPLETEEELKKDFTVPETGA